VHKLVGTSLQGGFLSFGCFIIIGGSTASNNVLPFEKTHCMLSSLANPSIGNIRAMTVFNSGTTSPTEIREKKLILLSNKTNNYA
jgi:hypothetical protein